MASHHSLMRGKKGIVMGVANERSIAWGIAAALAGEGAQVALSFQNEMLEKRVRPLAQKIGCDQVFPCDVSDQGQIADFFTHLDKQWSSIDFLVHALAWTPRRTLQGQFVDTERDDFLKTMDISCYSFISACRHARPRLNKGASLLTLSYYGAQKVMPNYNVMGVAKAALEASVRYLAVDLGQDDIRVNSLSAGPIKTLAASGISDFRYILKWNALNTPMRRTVTLDEIGSTALYLLSDMSSAVTGANHYVDCGYHVIGMKHPDAPDIAKVTDTNDG